MKKIVTSALAIISTFAIIGCGGGDTVIVNPDPEPTDTNLPLCSNIEAFELSIDASEYVINYLGGDVKLNALVYNDGSEISVIAYHYANGANIEQKPAEVSDIRGSSFAEINTQFNIAPNQRAIDISHIFELKQYCVREIEDNSELSSVRILAGGFTQEAYDDTLQETLDDIENQLGTLIEIAVDTNGDVQTLINSNLAPIADAGSDKEIELNQSILINGNGQDQDGNIVGYEWSENGVIITNDRSFVYTPVNTGPHILTLKVTDNNGASSTDTVVINVTTPPTEPAPNYCNLNDPILSSTPQSLDSNNAIVRLDLMIYSEDCINNFVVEHLINNTVISADTRNLTRDSIDNGFIHFRANILIQENTTGEEINHNFKIYYYTDAGKDDVVAETTITQSAN